jgi:Pretoxin HINT domain
VPVSSVTTIYLVNCNRNPKVLKPCCFAAGTLVETDHGLRPIEQIKVGDRVRSRDEKTGVTSYKRVTALIRPHSKEIYQVQLKQVGTGLTETFDATDDHPWMSKDGHWLTTLQLTAGGRLQSEHGDGVDVLSVKDTGHTADTFNLDVQDFHTFFVGKEHVWVHNSCALLNAVSGLRSTETIARGNGIREVARLVRQYGGRAQQWRKMKGIGELNGRTEELHWYQNDTLGKFEGKIKP